MTTPPSLSPAQLLGIIVLAVILDVMVMVIANGYFQKHGVGPGMTERLCHLKEKIFLWSPRFKGHPKVSSFRPLFDRVKERTPGKRFLGVDLPVLVLSVCLIGYGIWDYSAKEYVGWEWAWVCLIGGIVLFTLVLPRRNKEADASKPGSERPFEFKRWQIFCLISSPILAIIASAAAGFGAKMVAPVVAIVAWLAGIACALAGGWQFKPRQPHKVDYAAIFMGVLLIGIAFVIRGVSLADIPINLSGDEAESGLTAIRFLDGELNNPFVAGWFLFPSLYSAIQAPFIAIFGRTTEALRWSSVMIGALTVGAVYWVAQAMYGKRTALFASIFLSAYYFHNHFSRLGLNNAWDIFWYVVALGALWYAWEKQSRPYFLLAGFALGVAQYFYVSSRVMPALMLVWLVIVGLSDRRRLRNNWIGIVLMGLVAFVIVFPMGVYYLSHLDEFLGPITRVSSLADGPQGMAAQTFDPTWKLLLAKIVRSFLGYVHLPLGSIYTLHLPLLRFPSAILFCLGVSALFTRLRDSRTQLFLLWLVTFGLIGGFSEGTPAAQRLVAVVPAVAILVGYGLSELVRCFNATQFGTNFRRLGEVLALVAMLCIGAEELRYYFLDYTPNGWFDGYNSMIAQRMCDLLETKGDDWEVVFIGNTYMGYHTIQSVAYLAPQIIGTTVIEEENIQDVYTPSRQNQLFVFTPAREDDIDDIRQIYPGGDLFEEYYQAQLLFLWYEAR